ncbi:branched-chain amino acid transport system / permease component [Anaerotignum neopropionicum]|uniref:Branched-chain amino acid transport system / permease component n=1 Tax=Anaerotignum neopropionicum TaxID=36847 RepID=A0A136WFN3_9FIRM|nr:branched-chain amino acid transport system / permease component [Anaerotignum neopropionicum]
MVFVDLLISTLTQGFIYALLSYGVFITYKILDFPDLTVDGSFPLGAAITGVLMLNGMNPYLVLLVSAAFGAFAGFVTGFIHVRLGVRDLLAGIITMTALFSINLQIAGSNLAIERAVDTIFTAGPTMTLLGSLSLMQRKFIVALIIAVVVKILLDLYLKTKSGLLLRAVGDNSTLVTTLAKDKGTTKILGLVIANALVALCGSVVCQEQRAFASTMGTGQVVFGLATVIIGTTLFRRFHFVKGTTAVLVGSVFYKICIQVAISLGLPANLLKLVMAVLFLAVLILGDKKKGGAEYA